MPALVAIGLCLQAHGESLSTTDGATFDKISFKRVEPDGLYIEYTPPGGGVGMSKIKFSRLSPEQQKEFRYDPDKAKDYESKVARAAADWRQENLRWEQAAKAEIMARQARETQEDQADLYRIMAMAQLKQAEAELAGLQGEGNYGGWTSLGGGYGAIAIPMVSGENSGGLGRNEGMRRFRNGVNPVNSQPGKNPTVPARGLFR